MEASDIIRRAAFIEVAEKYHLDMAKGFRKSAILLREQGLGGAAEEDIKTAKKHEEYARDIINEVWNKTHDTHR